VVRPSRPAQPQATAPTTTRPATNVHRIDPRRTRRPRPTDTEPQPNPPK
jgi:hypothetical protein